MLNMKQNYKMHTQEMIQKKKALCMAVCYRNTISVLLRKIQPEY